MGQFAAQIRVRRRLRGELRSATYSIGTGQVLGRRARILPAAAVREEVGLLEGQKLVLQLFGPDPVLERLWQERETLLRQIAEAGYDLIIAPSYSLWTPRPRPEHLVSLKRSLVVFTALQNLGAPVVPRLAWAIEADAERLGSWAKANRQVEMAGLDLATYRTTKDWRQQLALLEHFDQLTARRLRYWIHGPSKIERFVDLFAAIDPSRLTLTNGRAIAAPRAAGTKFSDQERETRRMIAIAAEQSGKATVSEMPNRRRLRDQRRHAGSSVGESSPRRPRLTIAA